MGCEGGDRVRQESWGEVKQHFQPWSRKDKDGLCTSQLTDAVRSDFRFVACRECDLCSLCVRVRQCEGVTV